MWYCNQVVRTSLTLGKWGVVGPAPQCYGFPCATSVGVMWGSPKFPRSRWHDYMGHGTTAIGGKWNTEKNKAMGNSMSVTDPKRLRTYNKSQAEANGKPDSVFCWTEPWQGRMVFTKAPMAPVIAEAAGRCRVEGTGVQLQWEPVFPPVTCGKGEDVGVQNQWGLRRMIREKIFLEATGVTFPYTLPQSPYETNHSIQIWALLQETLFAVSSFRERADILWHGGTFWDFTASEQDAVVLLLNIRPSNPEQNFAEGRINSAPHIVCRKL